MGSAVGHTRLIADASEREKQQGTNPRWFCFGSTAIRLLAAASNRLPGFR
jgi:hypothetical protein